MANPFQESPIAAGFGDLVGALTGRGHIREEAQRRAQGSLKQIAEGEIAADEFRQRQALGQALQNLGVGQGEDLATVLRGGFGNFQQGTAGLQNLADMAIQSEALTRAQQPQTDLDVFNRILATRSGQGPLQPNEARVSDLGEQLVQKAQNQARLDAARVVTEQGRPGLISAQTAAAQALAGQRQQAPFKVGKPGQQVYTAPGGLGAIAPTADDQLNAAVIGDRGTGLTPAELATIAGGGEVRIPVAAPAAQLPQQARARLREGTVTRFQNGQSWTLQNGQPVRVK